MKNTCLTTIVWCFIALTAAGTSTCGGAAETSGEALYSEAQAVLNRFCAECHQGPSPKNTDESFDIRSPASMIDDGVLIPGKSEESRIVAAVIDEAKMPPKAYSQHPKHSEYEAVVNWINAGAPYSEPAPRPLIAEIEILRTIQDDLKDQPEQIRPHLRYFSLAQQHNNPAASNEILSMYRAALSKALNSLSWRAEVVHPTSIDTHKTLYRIDLRDFSWTPDGQWMAVMKSYPYGLTHEGSSDSFLRDVYEDIVGETSVAIPYVRVDWFVAIATRSPLYETLLKLPQSAIELEDTLGVERRENFNKNRAVRAGVVKSNVAIHNRVIERHATRHGAYWISYDFKGGDGRRNVLRYPLGPAFPANAFQDFSFTHDGGEIIFNLPNGLQAYLLVDDAGNRLLTPAPIDIVADETSRASGTAAVVNGLSCIACHSDGIKHASDVVRNGSSVGGEALAKVQSLHPIQEKFDELVRVDQDRYLAALKLSVAPFSDGNASNKLDTEPILLLARAYQKPLNLEKAATELNTTAERLAEAIRTHDSLRKMGLGPLAEGERITRSVWESREFAVSPMQQASRILGAGAPVSY